MYQFYYADSRTRNLPQWKQNIADHFKVSAVRPAMWEEHCLECSAPVCFESCVHYQARSDGRCKRFENGLQVFSEERACNGQGVHVKFCKWGNMMTVLFPAMLSIGEYYALWRKNEKLGAFLGKIAGSKLPKPIRWQSIRIPEFLRRRSLRNLEGSSNVPDAFLFHGYSYSTENYRLMVEIYRDHSPVFKTALAIHPGENLAVIPSDQLSAECCKAGNLVKIYPENNLEAELDILWCDFVQGTPVYTDKPATTVKCVVWDLDGTLWDGTLIETEDPNSLALHNGVLDIIKELDQRGILQSVASKNDYTAAWPILEKLGVAEYFLYPQIHWNAKSGSIQQIAESLNIGIDTFALVDDSAFERNQVSSALPQVRVFDITALPTLLEQPEFAVPVTEESRLRRSMYRAEEQRNTLKNAGHVDTLDFLRSCHLKLNMFTPKTPDEKLRCYELVVRTNQLNMSGIKYTPDEFEAVLTRPGHRNFAFSCADDFGSYGIVGFGQYRVEANTLIFTEFAMSCRVAGKYVESALFAHLLDVEKCKSGSFSVRKTKKNVLLRNSLKEIGFRIENDAFEKVTYVFDIPLLNDKIVSVKRKDIDNE